jgi:hypothetical protein
MRDPMTLKADWNLPVLVGVEEITGAVAMWAVRQHPYHMPKKLERVLAELHLALIKKYYSKLNKKQLGLMTWTMNTLFEVLEGELMEIDEFVAWNLRRSEAKKGVKVTDAERLITNFLVTHNTKPEDDFIDLQALFRNVCNSILKEHTLI